MEIVAKTKKLELSAVVKSGLEKALEAQYPMAVKNVERLRRVHPQKTPRQLVKLLDAYYLGAVTATGAGSGAAAIVPNVWLQGPVAAADLLTFLEASVLYTLSVAEIYGLHAEDIERRRLLVMAVLIGDGAAKVTLEPLLGRTVPYWGRKIVSAIPMSAIDAANKVLGPRFITKYGTKQGVLVLGKQIPMAIGVGVGAAGNHLFGRTIVNAARRILGEVPAEWGRSEESATGTPHRGDGALVIDSEDEWSSHEAQNSSRVDLAHRTE